MFCVEELFTERHSSKTNVVWAAKYLRARHRERRWWVARCCLMPTFQPPVQAESGSPVASYHIGPAPLRRQAGRQPCPSQASRARALGGKTRAPPPHVPACPTLPTHMISLHVYEFERQSLELKCLWEYDLFSQMNGGIFVESNTFYVCSRFAFTEILLSKNVTPENVRQILWGFQAAEDENTPRIILN